MQRKFLTNLALLLTLNFLVKPFWILGIDRGVQNTVGAEEYGFYFALLNFSFLFSIILDVGITNFNNKNIAQNQQLLHKHFSGILSIRLLLAIAYLVVTMGAGLLIGYGPRQLSLLAMLGFNQFLALFVLYLRSNISGLLLFRTDSLFSVMDRGIMILVCGVLLWTNIFGGAFKIAWFVYAQTFSYFVTALLALMVVIRRAGFKKMHWNRAFSLMILKQSFPFALLILLMTFHNRIDAVMLERLIGGVDGAREAGIYALAFRLLDAVNQIAYLFAVLLLPIFSRMLKTGDHVAEIVRLSFGLLMTVSWITATHGAMYGHELMQLFYHEHILESTRVFSLLIWCIIPMASTYVFGTLLTANGSLFKLNIIALVGIGVNIILNLWLIPIKGAQGSAIASLATQYVTALAQGLVAMRLFRFRISSRDWVSYLVFFLLTLSLAWLGHQLPLSKPLALTISGLLSLLSAIGLGLIRFSSFRMLLVRDKQEPDLMA